MASRQ
jgi:hypothetical protein